MVDVDIIILAGNARTYRSGITIDENIYKSQKKLLDEILDKAQHKFYEKEKIIGL